MNILTLDVETTTFQKGNPFSRKNKCVMVGFKWLDTHSICEFCDDRTKLIVQQVVDRSDLLVGFNIKFDLHWLVRIGVDISKIKVWDCQIAEFLLENQSNPYPSLNDALLKYGLPTKLEVVKTEYWNKGIDTDQIPYGILKEYLEYDLIGTEACFKQQYFQFTGKQL